MRFENLRLCYTDWEVPPQGHAAAQAACDFPGAIEAGILIENNIGYGTAYANFHQHYGKENIVRNNIWALGRGHQLSRARQEEHISFTFERNIVYFDNGQLLKGGWTNDKFVMDRNLYWDTLHPDGDIKFGEATFAEWQARGHDRQSRIADPRFVDPEQRDFRLRADSPAFQLGFEPIDTSQIGLYGDPEWVNAPKRLQRRAYIPPAPSEPQPTPIDDGFEDALVGSPPDNVTLSVEHVGSIVATDEIAAAGKQSLKFQDAPGQKYSFDPHLWYSPNYGTGKVRGTFDLRMNAGAIGHFEWREYSGGNYLVGPSLRIEGDGRMLSGGQEIGKVPLGQWLHIEIATELGNAAKGTWTLRYGPTHGERRQLDLSCDPKFHKLDWVGFVADATGDAVFQVDNVTIEPQTGGRPVGHASVSCRAKVTGQLGAANVSGIPAYVPVSPFSTAMSTERPWHRLSACQVASETE